MKKFIIQTCLFSLIALACFAAILARADGYTDSSYIRFTTPKQENLILGTSRAAQGLQPEVFKEILGKDIFNYSFTIGQSPYGSTYLNSVKRKVTKSEGKGIFILTVDPWSISSNSNTPNDSLLFEEAKLCLGNTKVVNRNPNFWYLLNNLGGRYYSLLLDNQSAVYLHNDGWVEVTVRMDSSSVIYRVTSKMEYYRNKLGEMKYSDLRFKYLKETIEFLNELGEVYLVRLPVHPEMMKIEEEYMPDFNIRMEEITRLTKGYYDITPFNNDFSYTDGNHLYKTSGKEVSEKVAKWIRDN